MTRSRRGEPDLPPGPARDLVDLFRGLRHTRRSTNAQLVARTGLAAGHVSDVLRGWKAPSPDSAQQLAEALGAAPDIARRARILAEKLAEINQYQRRRARAVEAIPPSDRPSLPLVWNVPVRNPHFTGRQQDLVWLRQILAEKSTVAVHAVHGMGGIGKTQTVIEYAHRHAAEYGLVWWLNTEQTGAMADQIAQLAVELGVPAFDDPDATLRAVKRHLRGMRSWLLIFDNAEEPDHVRGLLPDGPGKVLITTRRDGFRAIGGVVDLGTLDRSDSTALLRRRAPALAEDHAARLAERLGDLPLALDQVAAYLDQTGMPAEEYLELLSSRSGELYVRGRSTWHRDTIATIWSFSIRQVSSSNPASPDAPVRMARARADSVGPVHQPRRSVARAASRGHFRSDRVRRHGRVLAGFSLAGRIPEGLLLHRLVQEVTRQQDTAGMMLPAADSAALPAVLSLLRAHMPDDPWRIRQIWPAYRRFLPHILAATSHHDDERPVAAEDTAWLLANAGEHLHQHGRNAEALPLQERALHIRESLFGDSHPAIVNSLNSVGRVRYGLGRQAEALVLHQQAIRILETAFGPEHPELANTLRMTGRVLYGLGRQAEAVTLFERALRIQEPVHGDDHPVVAGTLAELGHVLSLLGREAAALPLQQRALRIHETVFGVDHPNVADSLTHVGRALYGLGRHAEAVPLHQRAVHIHGTSLGQDHPAVADSLNHLGRALSGSGRHAEAVPLHQRAVRSHQASLGQNHPAVADGLNHLGQALTGLGQYTDAAEAHRQTVRIHEASLGQNHPAVAVGLNCVGRALSRLGRHAEASSFTSGHCASTRPRPAHSIPTSPGHSRK
jgi:tetratricopeptide (TPR) repeat protein/transcriptional regulator with XRE-family HTH domain